MSPDYDVHVEMDTCRFCGETKPLDQFVRDKTRPTGRRHKCLACAAAYYRTWQDRNPDETMRMRREAVRRYSARIGWRQRRYGLSDEEFEAHRAAQSDACAICYEPFGEPCIDHIKGTKFVRGPTVPSVQPRDRRLQGEPRRDGTGRCVRARASSGMDSTQ